MNRRRFLTLLGSTAVAPALPAAAIGSLYTGGTQQGAVSALAPLPAAVTFRYEDVACQLVQYGMSVIYTDADHAEHVPIEDFMFTEEAA